LFALATDNWQLIETGSHSVVAAYGAVNVVGAGSIPRATLLRLP
jgi:hypothetical protein